MLLLYIILLTVRKMLLVGVDSSHAHKQQRTLVSRHGEGTLDSRTRGDSTKQGVMPS